MARGIWNRGDCESAHCVDVLDEGDVVFVRDSKKPDGPVLDFTREEWDSFVRNIKSGAFD